LINYLIYKQANYKIFEFNFKIEFKNKVKVHNKKFNKNMFHFDIMIRNKIC